MARAPPLQSCLSRFASTGFVHLLHAPLHKRHTAPARRQRSCLKRRSQYACAAPYTRTPKRLCTARQPARRLRAEMRPSTNAPAYFKFRFGVHRCMRPKSSASLFESNSSSLSNVVSKIDFPCLTVYWRHTTGH
jgi:hypothetical protein